MLLSMNVESLRNAGNQFPWASLATIFDMVERTSQLQYVFLQFTESTLKQKNVMHAT